MDVSRNPMPPLSVSMVEVRRTERLLRNRTMRFVLGNLFTSPIRRTRHFREWFLMPMNYARIMEMPLTLLLLKAKKEDLILDVSSPKLLALFFALNRFDNVVAADLEDYFVEDFETYKQHNLLSIKTTTFDAARQIPYPSSHFDKIYSISVLEHIPYNGDTLALQEILRVLKPSGTIVITLPAFTHYVEEWMVGKPYWQSVQNEGNETFFQRRYDEGTLRKLCSIQGAITEEILLIAENPIEQPKIGENGIMLHNSYLIDKVLIAHLINVLGRRLKFLPFSAYLSELLVSRRSHYLTTDWGDPNIRQVAVKISKSAFSDPDS